MYFLIIVIQLVGCGGSNPKTGVMVNGRSRRKRVGSQCSTVLSGEIPEVLSGEKKTNSIIR